MKRPFGICSHCQQEHGLCSDGTVRVHYDQRAIRRGRTPCEGISKPPSAITRRAPVESIAETQASTEWR